MKITSNTLSSFVHGRALVRIVFRELGGFCANQTNRKKIAYRELLPRVTASTQPSTPRGVLFFAIVELISGVWENENKIKQMEKKLHIGVRVGRLGAQAIARAPAIIPYYLAVVNKK